MPTAPLRPAPDGGLTAAGGSTSDARRYRPDRPRLWADIALAAAVLFLTAPTAISLGIWNTRRGFPSTGITIIEPISGGTFDLGAVFILLAAVGMPLAVVWRACRPVASSVVVYALALAHFVAQPAVIPTDIVIFLSLYSVTVHGPVWAERTALGSGMLGALLATLVVAEQVTGARTLLLLAFAYAFAASLVALAWGAGLLRRSRTAQRESLRDRAARLERERDQQAELATAAERTRIAREMHDIVAHSLSVIIAQADGGRYAAASDPEAASRALETIAETGRAALADTRRTLGVLRHDIAGAQSLAPQPSGADIDHLIAQIRDSGVPVSHVQMGTPIGLPPGISAAMYRILQEALTNVLKHGGPGARATVLTDWRPDEVRIVITDDGRGAATSSDEPGHGLIGMRERATMLGGSLRAGPGQGGGFRVEARIPLGAAPAIDLTPAAEPTAAQV